MMIAQNVKRNLLTERSRSKIDGFHAVDISLTNTGVCVSVCACSVKYLQRFLFFIRPFTSTAWGTIHKQRSLDFFPLISGGLTEVCTLYIPSLSSLSWIWLFNWIFGARFCTDVFPFPNSVLWLSFYVFPFFANAFIKALYVLDVFFLSHFFSGKTQCSIAGFSNNASLWLQSIFNCK